MGYKSKSGTTYGLYPRFYWDNSNVPFGSKSYIKLDTGGFRAGTAVMRKENKKGGRFSTV